MVTTRLPRMAAFTKASVRRAIEAVEAAGKPIAAIDFPPEGDFRIVIGTPAAVISEEPNPWDDVL